MRHEKLTETISIPQGCTFMFDKKNITVKGPKGEVTRKLPDKKIKIEQQNQELNLLYEQATKREKRMLFTTKAHIKNMLKGVQEGFTYKLKICSGHFPMNVSIKNDALEIKNFHWRKSTKNIKNKNRCNRKNKRRRNTVEALNKEIAGQTAGSIEKLTKRPGFDKRIFQDGIYIIEKDGKKII
jgi:large subunit ribosomal protein L6